MKKKYLPYILIGLVLIFILKSCGSAKKPHVENSTNEQLLKRIGELEEENKKLKKDYESALSTVKMYAEKGLSEEEDVDKNQTQEEKQEIKSTNNGTLGINDEWIVDGQWKLKILDVKTTQDRNQYSDKNPAQVVIVSYTYENLGYEDDFMDGLFLTPDQIIDSKNSVGYSYPANTTHNADAIPIGAKVDIAEEAFGLNNVSNEVSINFVSYDGNGIKQKATFKVPVK